MNLPDCRQCRSADQSIDPSADRVVWQDDLVRVVVGAPTGLPFVARVVPLRHVGEVDLDATTRRRVARTLKKITRALRDDPAITGFELTDTGAAADHLQVVVLARPVPEAYDGRTPLAFLDDLLPAVPADLLAARTAAVVRALDGSAMHRARGVRRRRRRTGAV